MISIFYLRAKVILNLRYMFRVVKRKLIPCKTHFYGYISNNKFDFNPTYYALLIENIYRTINLNLENGTF